MRNRRIVNHMNGTSEAHRDTLMAVAAINPSSWNAEQQLDVAIRAAKDLGAEQDPKLEIVPVYDRPGWWTSRPTVYVRLRADVEALRRNLAEQQRLVRCHPDQALGLPVLRAHAMNIAATVDMLAATLVLLDDGAEDDPVLARIDKRTAEAA